MSIFDLEVFNQRLFFPERVASAPPPGATDHHVDVGGAHLHLRVYGGGGHERLGLLFHGNGEVVPDYDGLAPWFGRAGLRLAVVDYRGYGQSTGVPTLRNAMDDAHAVVRFVAGLGLGAPVVIGRSVGSAAAFDVIGAETSAMCAAFVIDSGFCDLHALIVRRGLRPEPLSAVERERFDPLPKVARLSRPLLVVHGEEDVLIGAHEARAVVEAAPAGLASLEVMVGRGHNDLFFEPRYVEVLGGFVRGLSGG